MNKILVLIILLFLLKVEAQKDVSTLVIADSLYVLSDFSKAVLYYKQLPKSKEQQFKLAKSYEALGNNPKALYFYNEIIFNNPKAILARSAYAKLLFKIANYKEADSVFKALSEEIPTNPNYIYQRGLIKEKQKDTIAINYYLKTYSLDSNHINSIYKIAKLKLEKRKFLEAEIFIKKGLNVDSLSIRFLILKALKQYHNKEYHNAINTYEDLLKLGKEDEQLHQKLADCYFKILKIEDAIKQYIILINKYDDKNSAYHYNLGICYKALYYTEDAKKQFKLAIALKFTPLDKEYLTLAMLYIKDGNYKEAMEYLQLALLDNSKNELVNYQLAIAADNYFKDKNTALAYYQKYLKKFGETGKMRNLAKTRISDLKKELHFTEK